MEKLFTTVTIKQADKHLIHLFFRAVIHYTINEDQNEAFAHHI